MFKLNFFIFQFFLTHQKIPLLDVDKNCTQKSLNRSFIMNSWNSNQDNFVCDSVIMLTDLVGKLVSKEGIEFYDDEKYESESEL